MVISSLGSSLKSPEEGRAGLRINQSGNPSKLPITSGQPRGPLTGKMPFLTVRMPVLSLPNAETALSKLNEYTRTHTRYHNKLGFIWTSTLGAGPWQRLFPVKSPASVLWAEVSPLVLSLADVLREHLRGGDPSCPSSPSLHLWNWR